MDSKGGDFFMAIRHYVLFATDGFINVPSSPVLCAEEQSIYVFSFIGGLFKVIEEDKIKYIDPKLDWENSSNWNDMYALKGKGTIPAPIIWGDVSDRIYITLINLGMLNRPTLMDPHTVHIHGGHVATQLDGFPETSFGVPMWMAPTEMPPTITYFFQPENPGTYMYHCHVEASEHVQMGMYGGLVIYPSYESLKVAGITKSKKGRWFLNDEFQHQIPRTATNRNFAYNDINTYYDKEYVMLLSDIDSTWHNAVLTADPNFNAVNYKPDYWLVNGRAFPDTLLPHPLTPKENSDINLSQINYESYVHVVTNQKFLLRMSNLSYQVVPWHIHGWHFTVIGKDAHQSPFLKISEDLSHMDDMNNSDHDLMNMGFTATIGSGETYDLLLSADDKRPIYKKYIVDGQDCIPSLCSQIGKLDPNVIANIPTQPVKCPNYDTVNYSNICHGTQGVDQFFPQFYPAHNHDDYKVTNNGVYPGGQLIYIQTDAPKKHKICDNN
jgi:hypothetical protein